MAKRKTFDVAELVNLVNGICKDSDPEYAERRQGAMNVLECILHQTGNYKGFRYLMNGQCSGNPGVRYKDGNILDYPARFEDTDRTRVMYY